MLSGPRRQANNQEFERYIGHVHMKLRKPARHGRAGKQGEALAPAPTLRQGQRGHVPRQ